MSARDAAPAVRPAAASDAASRQLAQALAASGQCLAWSWQFALAWPQACAALQQLAWDTWAARWGGGVPLDG